MADELKASLLELAAFRGATPRLRMKSRADIAAEALRGDPPFTFNNQDISTESTFPDNTESDDYMDLSIYETP